MSEIKDIGVSSDKWSRRSGVAGGDYQTGIENPRKNWEVSSIEAKDNYKAGVTKAGTEDRFAKGVKGAGIDKWKRNSIRKGVTRFQEGVQTSKDEWEKGFKPYHEAIKALKLPGRGPKGDLRNIERVSTITRTLRALRERAL